MLDTLLEKLRAGDSVKKTRKRGTAKERLAARTSPGAPLTLMPSPLSVLSEEGEGNAGKLAQGMLSALQSSGFAPKSDESNPPVPMSPTKRRPRIKSDPLLEETLRNLTENPEMLIGDAEMVDRPEEGREPSSET